ncbi:MAG: glyoxalase [Sphingobacterium sp.]|uniref:VOC family protein n=1 Tax=Sphingobacterium sp. TaxID=341027 RepID=UPI00282D4917|nr:glyoxalase [Sphingobacterium sp.]MDR0262234.1 glyoxalase [Sphingobacterium sp.]
MERLQSGIFITFSGNCRAALRFYQACFGGTLHFEMFDEPLQGYTEVPVVSATLISERIAIYGSDLVHNEGRKVGNYLSVFMPCVDIAEREELMARLTSRKNKKEDYANQHKFIEVTDLFNVRWVLGVA